MTKRRTTRLLAAAIAAGTLGLLVSMADAEERPTPAPPGPAEAPRSDAAAPSDRDSAPQIPDPVLVDQNGERHRFYTDLVKGKLVLMNSIFTSCPGTCPAQTAIFAQVQQLLADRPGMNVQMLSVSLDPVTDTPERLKEFADRFHAKPGWLFLTGPKQDVTEVLQAMDIYSADPADHTPMAAIGHEPAGLWMKVINLNAPADIAARVERVKALGDERLAK